MGPKGCTCLLVLCLTMATAASAPARETDRGRALVRHLRAHPDDLSARYALGKLLFRRGAYEKALRLWTAVLRHRPASDTVLKRIGLAHYKLGAFDESRAVFARVLERSPGDAYAAKALARIDRLQGRRPSSPPPSTSAAKGPPKAAPAPETPSPPPAPRSGEEAFEEGKRLLLERRFEAAIPCFRRALDAEVEVYAARYHLADCMLRSVQDLPEACSLFEACIAMKPDLTPPYLRLALAWGARGDGRRQIEVLERCLAVDPEAAEAHFHLALAHDRLDDSKRSFRHATEAIRLDPSYRKRFSGLLRNSNVARKIASALDGALDRVHLTEDEIEGYVAKITEILGAENVREDLRSAQGRSKVRRLVADESRLDRLRDAFRSRDANGLQEVLADAEIDVDVEGAIRRFGDAGATTF